MILVVLLQLIFLQISTSVPLQYAAGSKNLLNLANFDIQNDFGTKRYISKGIYQRNRIDSKIINSNVSNDDNLLLIVNGELASRGQFPYQVGLLCMVSVTKGYLCCGGSLISPNYVLTAAHCVKDVSNIKLWAVVLGGLDLYQKNEVGRVVYLITSSSIKVHENYSSITYINDIALIQLPKTVQQTAYIEVVQLPTLAEGSRQNTYDGKPAIISGWGRTLDSSKLTSSVLRHGNVSMLNQLACIEYYKLMKYRITDGQICTAVGVSKANTCNGDSGGPLVVSSSESQKVQIGIVSLGATKCESGFPATFTRIGFYLNWIASNSDVKIK